MDGVRTECVSVGVVIFVLTVFHIRNITSWRGALVQELKVYCVGTAECVCVCERQKQIKKRKRDWERSLRKEKKGRN